MSKEGILLLLGVLVASAPFWGVPYSALMWILPVLGIVVFFLALSLRSARQKKAAPLPTFAQTGEALAHESEPPLS